MALVGHSFGALVAVAAATDLGHRVRALVLIDSRIRVTDRAARFMDALRKLPHPVYRSAADAVARYRLLPSDHSSSAEVLAHVARHAIRQIDGESWTLKFDRRAMVNTNPVDLSAALGRVGCPILVVRGCNSSIMTHAALEEFSAAAPHASVVEIEGAHHHVMLDRPELLASAVRSFLDAKWAAG
jgi:pimeloyl-ACP methyl ester carboxylesterase